MKVIELIEQAVLEQNSLESKIPKRIANITPFKVSDFDYLPKYLDEFNGDFNFYEFISYCNVLIWDEISTYESRKSIWYWENIKNDSFIKEQINTIRNTLKSYALLLKSNHYKTAFIVFRTFIELSSQFFACIIDFEFYLKYTKNLLDSEYQNHWFKHLKPSKVISNLRKISMELNIDGVNNYARHLQNLTFPFFSVVRNQLYEDFSNICHGNYNRISDFNTDEIEKYMHMTTDYLSTVTNILQIAIGDYLFKNKEIDTRKHIVSHSIWIKAIYK